MVYALPLVLVGFGGMINETLDRIMLGWWGPGETADANKAMVGVYSACYKLAILITISIQAFRMGAEPFFFKQAETDLAQKTYAKVMKFFVISLCVMFLFVMLYIDIWSGKLPHWMPFFGNKFVSCLPIFNLADVAILAGIALVVLSSNQLQPTTLAEAEKEEEDIDQLTEKTIFVENIPNTQILYEAVEEIRDKEY